jgi:hypothetical protein
VRERERERETLRGAESALTRARRLADRKMILLRDGLRVVPLHQCDIHRSRRFAFYDQVRTKLSFLSPAPVLDQEKTLNPS